MSIEATLDEKQLNALKSMRLTFAIVDGAGLPLNDLTFMRYLRAR